MSHTMRYLITLVETAQQSSEPLQRARDLGFDTDEPVYHGTRAGEFPAFKTHYRRNEQLGFGIHVTPDLSFAERYAHDPVTARKGRDPHVFAGYLRKGRVLDADAMAREGSADYALCRQLAGRRFITMKDEHGVPCCWVQTCIDATSGKRAEALIRAAGYDTIRYRAKIASRTGYGYQTHAQAVTYVVLNPACLRRSDAAFDPMARDSDDLRA